MKDDYRCKEPEEERADERDDCPTVHQTMCAHENDAREEYA
jgi:hypothetical protein